jgi:hypothetical protein
VSYRVGTMRFVRILLTMGSGESSWLIVAFLLGLIALGVLSNLAYGLLADAGSLSLAAIARTLVAVAALIGVAFLAYRIDLHLGWRPVGVSAAFREHKASRHAGLVWLLSLGSLELPLVAIRHHVNGDDGEALRHCWVLLTPAVRQASVFQQFQERVEELGYDVRLHPVDLHAETAEETCQAVSQIYSKDARMSDIDLRPKQIIVDITGGNKPMSVGVVMACLPNDWPLEYIVSQRNPISGDYEAGTQEVVLLNVNFAIGA